MNWLLRPLNTLPVQVRVGLTALFTSLAALLSFGMQRRLEPPFQLPDHEYYVLLARGQNARVPQPFASRPLAPLLAKTLSQWRHVPVETGFFWLGCASMVVVLAVVFGLAMRTSAPRWLLLVLAVAPFPTNLLHTMVLPDPLSASLLCGLLLCLAVNEQLAAAALLFPLMLARDSTSLVLLCLLAVGWRQLRVLGCLVAVGAAVAGSAVVRLLSAGAADNAEHLPTALYLAAKVPWNLLRLLGLLPWSNLYPYLCAPPQQQMHVHLGPLRSLGVCSVSPVAPIMAAMAMLTAFGLLPVLLLALWRVRWRKPWSGRFDLLTRFCLLYGGISFVLAPLIGTEYDRLYGYAWPLFFVALPRLFPAPEGLAERPVARNSDPSEKRKQLSVVTAFFLLQTALGAVAFLDLRLSALGWEAGISAAAAWLLLVPGQALLAPPKVL